MIQSTLPYLSLLHHGPVHPTRVKQSAGGGGVPDEMCTYISKMHITEQESRTLTGCSRLCMSPGGGKLRK